MGRKRVFCQNGNFGGIFSPRIPQGATKKISKMGERWSFRYWDLKNWIQHHKNNYKDIRNGILDKHYKKPPKGDGLALKEPPGHTQELSSSTDQQNYVATN